MLLGQGFRAPSGAVVDEYGEMVELYWQGKTEELGENGIIHKAKIDKVFNMGVSTYIMSKYWLEAWLVVISC
jgi:hypothetical protein